MAMTRNAIEKARELQHNLDTHVNANIDISLSSLGANAAPFQDFLATTEGGKDFFEKYQKLLKLVAKYYSQAQGISKILETFLDEQERLNS